MIRYRCKKCDTETYYSECPICRDRTELISSEIYWCDGCNIPIFENKCPICGSAGRYISTDIRPVFPEERLLVELLMDSPLKYLSSSVWCSTGGNYIFDGKRIKIGTAQISNANIDDLRNKLHSFAENNASNSFSKYSRLFIKANEKRYEYLTKEATDYIRQISENYRTTEMYVSFSGGKDSTVTSDLVMRALSNPEILHIYGDTTLEFQETKDYVDRFKKQHPKTPILISKNKDKNFEELCTQLGPPSRVMRWCCTIFKTGAIQRKLNTLFKNSKRILTFYGIRRNESNSRSKYDRESDSPKITIQKTVSPIIDWLDFDIWLYILTTGIDFNNAYRYGYTRVGCWCCPNNSSWSNFMSRIYMPEEYNRFRDLLIEFAKKIGKPDPETYVDEGNWKARQGGNGLEYAKTSLVTFEPCALQENTINFELQRPISEELYELFKPFGYINKTIGNDRLGEVYITAKDGTLLLKLQGKVGSSTLKVSILSKKVAKCNSIKAVEDKIKCQITKYQMCMGCLACESICKHGAIKIATDRSGLLSYNILDDKCLHCGECIDHYNGGCYMRKVMTIKR